MNFPSIVTGKYAFNVEYNNGRWWLHTNDADFDFISDDGGDTWTEITQNKSFRGQVDTLSVQGLFIGCSVGFTDPYYNTGFYATSSDGIYWEDGDPDQTSSPLDRILHAIPMSIKSFTLQGLVLSCVPQFLVLRKD